MHSVTLECTISELSAERDALRAEVRDATAALSVADTAAKALQQRVDALEVAVAGHCATERELRGELDDRRDTILTLERGINEHIAQLDANARAYEEVGVELTATRRLLVETRKELDAKQQRVAELELALADEHQNFEETRSKLIAAERQRNDFAASVESLTKLHDHMKEEMKAMEKRLHDEGAARAESDRRHAAVAGEVAERAAGLERQVSALQTKLSEKDAMAKSLADRCHTAETALSAAQQHKNALEGEKLKLEHSLVQLSAALTTKSDEVDALTAKLKEESGAFERTRVELDGAKRQLEAAEALSTALRDDLTKHRGQLKSLAEQRDRLRTDLDDTNKLLDQNLAELSDARAVMEEELKQAKKELDATLGELASAKQHAGDLHSELVRLRMAQTETKATADRTERTNKQLSAELADARSRIESHHLSAQKSDSARAELQSHLEQLRSRLHSEEGRTRDVQQKLVAAEKRVADLVSASEATAEQHRRAADASAKEIAHLKRDNAAMRDNLAKAKEANDKYVAAFNEKRAEIDALRESESEKAKSIDELTRKYNSLMTMYTANRQPAAPAAPQLKEANAADAALLNDAQNHLRELQARCKLQESELQQLRDEAKLLRAAIKNLPSSAETLEDLQRRCGVSLKPVNTLEGQRRAPKRHSMSGDAARHDKAIRKSASTALASHDLNSSTDAVPTVPVARQRM